VVVDEVLDCGWIAAGLRACLPESEGFWRARRLEKDRAAANKVISGTMAKTRTFVKEMKTMLHWKLWIYTVLLMSEFSFLLQGSQVSFGFDISFSLSG
jgi:hypothetical protein